MALMKLAVIPEFFARLKKAIPEPETELEYDNVYQLLVAVVLSAQATDAGVNRATTPLFKAILGGTLLRCLARAEEIHRALAARGFRGSFRSARPLAWRRRDSVFLGVCSVMLCGWRLLWPDLAEWLR